MVVAVTAYVGSVIVIADFDLGSIDRFNHLRRSVMQWTTPAFVDLRFGFEITMYIASR